MSFASGAARALFVAAIFAAGSLGAQAQESRKATAADMRPPADMLVDCAKAPKDAVTKLPAELAQWATVYCTRNGHLFNTNEKFYGIFPDSKLRATIDAASMDGKKPEEGANSYFTAIEYSTLTDAHVAELLKLDPAYKPVLTGKPLKRLDLTSNGGHKLMFVVVDPAAEPFWVFPLTDKGLGTPAFFVVSLATFNRNR